MDIVDRLFELVDKKFNEQQEFAALLGVDPTLPSRWRNRKSTSYQRRLPQIAEALGTTTEYLLTGNGPKKKTAPAKRSESDAISDDDIKAAFFEGAEDLTNEEMDALWADARDYMRYKLEQRRKQQQIDKQQFEKAENAKTIMGRIRQLILKRTGREQSRPVFCLLHIILT